MRPFVAMQPSPCQPDDRHEWGRCYAGECAAGPRSRNRNSCALHAASKPATPNIRAISLDRWSCPVCPSLRAHLNPILSGARSTRTLTGFCILFNAVRRALLSNPPNLVNAAHPIAAIGPASLTMLYVLTNFALAVRKFRRSPRGCCRAILLPVSLDRLTFSLRTGACARSSPHPAPGR